VLGFEPGEEESWNSIGVSHGQKPGGFSVSKVVSACVALAIGPVTARAIELLLASKQAGGGTMSMLLVTWPSILVVYCLRFFNAELELQEFSGIWMNLDILPQLFHCIDCLFFGRAPHRWDPCHLLRETQVVLVIVIWFLPTYLILRLLKALPVDFERCRTVPELWEYDFPRFNLVVRVAFVLLLALSLFWSSLTLTSPLVEVLMRKNLTFNAKVALRLALAGILYFGCGVQMFVWIVYLIPTHRALFVKARMPYRPSSYIEIGETHPEFNLAKEVQLAKMFLNLCLCFIGLS